LEPKICGRLDQNDIPRLIGDFAWADEVFNRSQAEGRFNVSPGSVRPVMHVVDGALFVDDLFWGYRSAWAEASGKAPIASNTRMEKIQNAYWKPLLRKGRVIVPADGWYEWTGEKPHKQPWHIHRVDRAPLYLAGLASLDSTHQYKGANGFTLVTADAQGGMIDIHDRRPLVLTAEDALVWLDPDMPAEGAVEYLRSAALGQDAFAWYMVDRAVGNVRNQGQHLAEPLPT